MRKAAAVLIATIIVPALILAACRKKEEEPPPEQGGYGAQYGQQPGYGQPQPGYGQPQPGYGQPQPGYGQPQPGYGQPTATAQPYPTATAPAAAPMASGGFPCQADAMCLGHKCNTAAGRCAWPCASANDCQPGFNCMAPACVPGGMPGATGAPPPQ